MAKNFCIFRTDKIKSSAGVISVLKEQQRATDYISERADSSLSHLNTYSESFEKTAEKFQKLLPKNYRKNAVFGLNFIVSATKEFKSSEEEKKYYSKAVEYIGDHFGKVVGWAIHRDETSTHMQVVTIPLVDGKLNARKLIGGSKNRLKEFQSDFYETVGKQFGLERGEQQAKPRNHKKVEQFLQEKEEELIVREKKIEQHEKIIKNKKVEIEIKEKELKQREFVVESKELFQRKLEEVAERTIQTGKIYTAEKPTLIEYCKSMSKEIWGKIKVVKQILTSPLEKVEQLIEKAKKHNCKNLDELYRLEVVNSMRKNNEKVKKSEHSRSR